MPALLITAALRHVKIPALTRYLTGGGMLEYVVTQREQGGGIYTQVRLPMGVTAALDTRHSRNPADPG